MSQGSFQKLKQAFSK